MQSFSEPDNLSFGDALFLYLERPGAPLNIASVTIFDGIIKSDDFTWFVQSKLPQIPRYLQKVVMPAFNVGLPTWEFDPEFNIQNHIGEYQLKRGTEAELKTLASKILSTSLNRQHPLWKLDLVHGLKGKRTAMVVRVHHSMADGLSGIGLLNALMDTTPTVSRIIKKKLRIPVSKPRTPESEFLEPALRSWFSTFGRVLTAGDQLLTMAQRIIGVGEGKSPAPNAKAAANGNGAPPSMEEVLRLLPEIAGLPERLPFNLLCRGPQRFEWTEIPLAELKAIKNKCEVKINDVLLTLLTSAFRRYSESRGVDVRGRSLRIVVPVNTRQEADANDLGNHITFVPVSVPLDIHHPRKVMSAVHERMQFIKGVRLAEFVAFAGNLLGTIPGPLQPVLASYISSLPLSLCNTICTNVPGPAVPYYMLGCKMVCAYPYVPIGGEMGLNCAVLTYDGKAFFGFIGDTHAAPQLELMPQFVQAAMKELQNAAGIRAKSKPRKKRVIAKVPRITEPSAEEQVTSTTEQEEPMMAAAAGAL